MWLIAAPEQIITIFKGWLRESNSDVNVKLMLFVYIIMVYDILYMYIYIFIPQNKFKTKSIIAIFKLKSHFRDLLE